MSNCIQIYMQISASTDFFEGLSSNLTPIFVNIRSHLHTLCWKHSLCYQVEDSQSIVCEGKMRSQATSPLSPTRLHPILPGPRPSARQLRQLWHVAETKGRKDAERSWQHQHREDENTTGYYRPNGSTRLGNGLLLRFDWVLHRTLNIVKWWMDCQFCKLTRKNPKTYKNIYYEILRVCWHVINIHLCPVRDINMPSTCPPKLVVQRLVIAFQGSPAPTSKGCRAWRQARQNRTQHLQSMQYWWMLCKMSIARQ